MKELADLIARVADLERRHAGQFRHGTVEEVDAAKQRCRLKLGEGEDGTPFLGPWVPYAQLAGAMKAHVPVSKGQQMTLMSPTGDFRQAIAVPFTFSESNPSPSDKADENVMTYGSWTITLKENDLIVKGPNVKVEADTVKVQSARIDTGDGGEGRPVARIGDRVHVAFGSSAGLHPIVEGSGHLSDSGPVTGG